LLPIFNVYQSRNPQYGAEINPAVNSLRSGRFPTIDPLGTPSSRVVHDVLSTSVRLLFRMLLSLSLASQCHKDDAA